MNFVVVVEKGPYTKEMYGPYRSFKRAEGDARAWGGSVEPLKKPEQGAKDAR
jgi:hypothetical protein